MDLTRGTAVNRFVPKEKFYAKTAITTKLKQLFTDEIEKITWKNKISPDTLNITAGDYAELQVFEIALKGAEVSTAVLKHIDTFIPYPILFIVKKPGAVKAVMSYKEITAKSSDVMKVDSYFDTGWRQELSLELKGRSVDEIYKNYLYQIAPQLQHVAHGTAKVAVETNKEHQKLQKQIDTINRQIAKEPAIAKKQELARERFLIEQQMENMV
ncbi:DUF4391 domain-containing protein [Candidatus Saccharibacteria bacterium]|nr:DUF4391 domain-containing protein [Candidatus Saccharibacteria bacterium]